MLRSIRKQAWICVKRQSPQRRWQQSLATAAVATVGRDTHSLSGRLTSLVDHSTPGAQNDDQNIRQIFDSQKFWREFSQPSGNQELRRWTGLFQNRYLVDGHGFRAFAETTLEKAKKQVSKILNISTLQGYKNIARDLDTLSDLLCRVIDLCDFVRATYSNPEVRPTHSDIEIRAAATSAYVMMFEYMNVLNTTTGLYDQLKKALEMPEVVQSWSEEEKITAQILMRDFAKSAIDLPPAQRKRFVDSSSEINRLGSEFVDNLRPEKNKVSFPNAAMKGLDPWLAKQLAPYTRWGKTVLVGRGIETASRSVHNEDVRRELYVTNRRVARDQIDRLEQLLKLRAEIASLSGFPSFAHMTLGDKMAKSPESVDKFLQALHRKNKGRAEQEYSELLQLKQHDRLRAGKANAQLNAWDKDYYASQQSTQAPSRTRHPDSLSAYFSLGTVMQGLSRLFSRLYGLRLVPRPPMPGETWDEEVRRLDVMDENEGHVAVVYCDLFKRGLKNPNPAHFTLRCSRHISREEIAETQSSRGSHHDTIEALTDGMASTVTSTGELYQLPTIALICDFARPSWEDRTPPLLSFREVQTLFHEMGHALHSFVGRTSMQNVSGTRCATDLAELPSVLMEHFATAPEVLALFARHWATDAPLPPALLQTTVALHTHHEASDIETQIVLAALDQVYHSPLALPSSSWSSSWSSSAAAAAPFDTTKLYHDVVARYASIPEPPESNWQGLFGHLFGYGATYYAYLFDRAIAGRIWKEVFQRGNQGAVSSEAGGRFREELLRWGGSRDGWACVAGVLGDERLAEGGEKAMERVGEWGVHD
ncbi:MAG: Mitochondrial intermediate peptidase [Peltula sp. TS41687]|nr:MAG: Mitochondrial intermediate peptidase [Peltula sp. TS41687]